MDPFRYVRKELMAYKVNLADREELLQRMANMDKDIRPKAAILDGMPRAKGGLSRSVIESTVIKREESLQEMNEKLVRLERKIQPVEIGLAALRPIEREVIEHIYMDLEYSEYEEIAASMGLTLREMERIQEQAVWLLAYILEDQRYKRTS